MTDAHLLVAEDLSLGYGRDTIVEMLSLRIPPGRITAIVGANACGKSTLLRGLARLLAPRSGSVLLDGRSLQTMPSRDIARTLGMLPQSPSAPSGITVLDLVKRGRHPHRTWLQAWGPEDDDAVFEALTSTSVLELEDTPVDELSGGQRQRVWIAMALAQRTDVLLLDEPTTFLDVAHQVEVLDLLVDLNDSGRTIVMVLHDLGLAARYADHVVAMRDGAIVAEGAPGDVVTEDLVHDVFGLRCRVETDPVSGTLLVVPIGRRRTHESP